MLEHVGHAALAGGIVHRSGVHEGVEGHHGRFVPLVDDPMHSVGQGEFGDVLFKLLQVLRLQQNGGGRQYEQPEVVWRTSSVCLSWCEDTENQSSLTRMRD